MIENTSITKTSDDYISNRAWLYDAVKNQEVILSHTSALEYLQLFVGYTLRSAGP